MRLMSFALTTQQIIDEAKDVTRRLGWQCLKPGDLVQAVVKCMGLKPGETVERLRVLKVVSITREPLNAITQDDVDREGFPDMSPREFVSMFCKHMKCRRTKRVTRIEFEYVKENQL